MEREIVVSGGIVVLAAVAVWAYRRRKRRMVKNAAVKGS
jgi:uncharacterized membrane protein